MGIVMKAGNIEDSRTKLLSAALRVVRQKGYVAARIDDICNEAGLTKGSFFHHFKSKDELALAAVDYWNEMAEAHFSAAGFREHPVPLDRILGYIDFRISILSGDIWSYSCLLGTMVPDVYDTHPNLLSACNHGITRHVETIEPDIALTMFDHGIGENWTAKSLAFHIQAVIQGALILAKAQNTEAVAIECLRHLRCYVELLFRPSEMQKESRSRIPSTSNVGSGGEL